MKPTGSEYYPPRAGARIHFRKPWVELKRTFALEKLGRHVVLPLRQILPGILIPGYSFIASGRGLIGRGVMIAYGLSGSVFLIMLGYTIGNLAFAALLSLHVTSILYLLSRWTRDCRWLFRIIIPLLTLFAVSQLLYFPLLRAFNKIVMPTRITDKVIVLNRLAPFPSGAGEVIAYAIPGVQDEGLLIEQAFGLGPILAGPGDRIAFTSEDYSVNGRSFSRLPHMPAQGTVVVPQKGWFIWPKVAIRQNGAGAEGAVSAALAGLAMVPQSRYVGKPFRHWFWRRQIVP